MNAIALTPSACIIGGVSWCYENHCWFAFFFNVGIVPASSSGASFFAWQRRARNTSDWWWTARDYGKGTDGGRSACQILCRFLCKKTASLHTGCGQAILFSNLATWTGLNSFLKISKSSALKLPAILKATSARRLARCLLPAFLCAHIERETSGYEAEYSSVPFPQSVVKRRLVIAP